MRQEVKIVPHNSTDECIEDILLSNKDIIRPRLLNKLKIIISIIFHLPDGLPRRI
jgi:hypothetical protein